MALSVWPVFLLLVSVSCVLEKGGWRCGEELYPLSYVCDGVEQCDDNSDEGLEEGGGCNLFPESGCPSSGAKEHFKCQRTGECFLTKEEAYRCESSEDPPDRECQDEEGNVRWKCKNGRCIQMRQVCDNIVHCSDKSDESRDPYGGCNRYPNTSSGCLSWGGEKYTKCEAIKDQLVCTNMDYDDTDPETCRECNIQGERRCDNGICINATLFRNGIPDCLDGSDELKFNFRISYIIIITVVVVITGIMVSFICRALGKNNVKSCFHCNLCSSSKRTPASRSNSNRGDQVDCHTEDCVDLIYPDDDIPIDLINLLDDKVNNWEKRRQDSVVNFMMQSQFSPTTLKVEAALEAKRLYVEVHTNPVQYHHLYNYLASRCATVQELSKVTNFLYNWEKEMHGMNKQEVSKCWRLHLGATKLTKQVMNSVADEPSLYSRCKNICYPIRQGMRRSRRNITSVRSREDSLTHKILTIAWTTIFPFVEASFFYFEQIKNVVFVHIFWTALVDLSHNQPTDHPFEFTIVFFMIFGIIATQILFLVYSFYFAADIFEVGHSKECKRTNNLMLIGFKVLSIVISPFIPCYVLANHVYYNAQMSLKRRHLQTMNDSADVDGQPSRLSPDERIDLYKNICRLDTKSLMYRKMYSYYRVTSAILESTTVLVSLILLLFVTGRTNRPIKLIIGVEHRLYSLLGITAGTGILSELNLMRDVVINGSLIFSLGIVLSALVKYWYQAKNLSISGAGQVSLGLYLMFILVNKLTTCVSLFATTQPLPQKGFDDGTKDPRITLEVALTLFCLLLMIRVGLVYFYKRRWSRSWKKQYVTDTNRSVPDVIDHLVNVLINIVVVIPFMVQTEPLAVLKNIEQKLNLSPEEEDQKMKSLRKKTNLLRLTSRDGHEVVDSLEGVMMPNMNFFTGPLLYDDLRSKIRFLWWENPTEKLDVAAIRKKMDEDEKFKAILDTMTDDNIKRLIEITLEHLENVGMVNKAFLNPAQTKREYFWLFLFVILENLIALGIELGNGGVWTSQGHYYSWDVRLISFTLSLVFLSVYYNKYHLMSSLMDPLAPRCGGWIRDLPVLFCCQPETGLADPPDELTIPMIPMRGGSKYGGSKNLQNRSSLIAPLLSPSESEQNYVNDNLNIVTNGNDNQNIVVNGNDDKRQETCGEDNKSIVTTDGRDNQNKVTQGCELGKTDPDDSDDQNEVTKLTEIGQSHPGYKVDVTLSQINVYKTKIVITPPDEEHSKGMIMNFQSSQTKDYSYSHT